MSSTQNPNNPLPPTVVGPAADLAEQLDRELEEQIDQIVQDNPMTNFKSNEEADKFYHNSLRTGRRPAEIGGLTW